jgi:hypothetical protein
MPAMWAASPIARTASPALKAASQCPSWKSSLRPLRALGARSPLSGCPVRCSFSTNPRPLQHPRFLGSCKVPSSPCGLSAGFEASRLHESVARLSSNPAQRGLATTPRRHAYAQPVATAEAYIQSGVVSKAENPIDVKKVLVIGSGGIAIGQAGEFDYSGMHTCDCSSATC